MVSQFSYYSEYWSVGFKNFIKQERMRKFILYNCVRDIQGLYVLFLELFIQSKLRFF